jgi:hypothetical protein
MPPENEHGDESDNSKGEGTAPKYITSEELNKAVTARLQAFEKSFDKKHKETLSEALKGLVGEIDGLVSTKLETMVAAKSTDGKDKGKSGVEDNPMVLGLKKELADLRTKAEQAEKRAAAEEARAKDIELRRKLGDELGKHGVDSSRAKMAVGFLIDSDKRARYSDEGEILFRDEEGNDLELAAGVKAWIRSEDAKIYLPPKGMHGSGERPSSGKPKVGADGKMSRAQLGEALLQKMKSGVI